MLLIIILLFSGTMYVYYTSLMPKGMVREFVASAILLLLVASMYTALALGYEIPPVNTFIHEFFQGLVQQ